MTTHYDLIASNKWRSVMLVVILLAVVVGITYLLYYAGWAPFDLVAIAVIFTGIWTFISYFWSDQIILLSSGAQPASKDKYFDFYTVTENLAGVAQIPMPKIYVVNDPAPNAFATGRNPDHAAVCATTGLLERLNRAELEAVIAHELSHVQHYDILLSSLVAVLVGALVMVVDMMLRGGMRRRSRDNDNGGGLIMILALVLAIIAPILLNLMQLALSRRREYYADAGGVELTRNPEALISALRKISADPHQLRNVSAATAELYITDPIKKKSFWQHFSSWFSTHPPLDERISVLQKIT